MNAIQEEMVKAPILKYFNLRQKTVLQKDTSCKGLGACLLQDGHPIYFVSKSLTDAEKGYVAIELEALAVSWACEKFHHFLLWLPLHLTDGSKTPGINTGTFSQ